MDIEEVSFVEIDVGDIAPIQETLFLPAGFVSVAHASEPDGQRRLILSQNAITLLLTSGGDEATEFVRNHGYGVRDIAFRVPDVASAFEKAVQRGATPIRPPTTWRVAGRRLIRATITGIGDLVHSFIDDTPSPVHVAGKRLVAIDHFALCLEAGTLESTVDHYIRALGFHVSHEEDVQTERSGMRSKVVESPNGKIRFALQEPMAHSARGQIADFLVNNGGPGVQHIAFQTNDILGAVTELERCGIEFLKAPVGYYDTLHWEELEEQPTALRISNVLVDRDQFGYLLQIFTKSQHPRRTLFFEFIQRRNSRGFGSANIRALFRAVEQQT